MTKQAQNAVTATVPGDSSGAGAPRRKVGYSRGWECSGGPQLDLSGWSQELAVVEVSPLRPKSGPAHRREAQNSKRSGLRNVSRAP